MASVREQIIVQVLAYLNDASKPASVPAAKRTYTYAIDPDQLPAINVFPVKEDAKVIGDRLITVRTLTVAVECIALGTTIERPDQKVDPLVAWVVKALAGKRSAGNLGPFHMMSEDGTEFQFDQQDHAYVAVRVNVVVQYQTKTGDLEVFA